MNSAGLGEKNMGIYWNAKDSAVEAQVRLHVPKNPNKYRNITHFIDVCVMKQIENDQNESERPNHNDNT